MNQWDERYSEAGYAYGDVPNDFLREVAPKLSVGRVLCLGEGEGRNAVFLAEQGHQVTAVDLSEVGLAKASALATERGVALTTVHANLSDYVIEPGAWDTIVSIWCHLPSPLRRRVYAQVVSGLKAGGHFVLEAYTPRQLQLKTGGPPVVDMLLELKDLREDLPGFTFEIGRELDREVNEGRFHHGLSAVVQVLARK
jgi:SAM-dependent methyltransferase